MSSDLIELVARAIAAEHGLDPDAISPKAALAGHVIPEWMFFGPMAHDRLAHSAPKDVPEGWRLVPVEPTEAMCIAGWDGSWIGEEPIADLDAGMLEDIYRAMIAAAPSLSKDD